MMEREQTALLVIDFQDALLAKIPVADAIMDQAVKLIGAARVLGLPIICTEQYPKGLGRTAERIVRELEGVTAIEKLSFGCFGEPKFCEAVAATGRTQLLVAGVETHVCVMQTVLAGLARGHEAFVARDAVGSRFQGDYEAGMARMAACGAQMVSTEMAIFELLRAAGTPEFKKILPIVK